jgi:hypothetical protein
MSILLEYCHGELGCKVIIDDDGKTGYAYLIVGEEMVSDVWLYNVGSPSKIPEWTDCDNLPFANSVDCTLQEHFDSIHDATEISLDWEVRGGGLWQVCISLRGVEHAILRPGAKPGWCRLAVKESPIARPLNEAK